MRSPLILALFLCSLLGPISAGASEDAQQERQEDTAVKAEAGSTDDVYIPWTWEDVDD